MRKIFRFISILILPLIVVTLTVVIIHIFNTNKYMYIITAIINLLAMYYLSVLILGLFSIGKEPKSLYSWLDSLNGGEKLLKELFANEEEGFIVSNLERSYSKIMVLTNHNINKLRLLRAYYKVKSEEDALDIIFKSILSIFIAVLLWWINKGVLWNFVSDNLSIYAPNVSKNYVRGWGFAFIMWNIIIFFVSWIRDYFNGKKRIKLIIEILDVCIKNNEK